ncbi:MAG TPA: hypothetical protein VNA20_06345 [Frankiaceae bacterium]|nr:hypothetical protein [Frankiaceae bacterium]
MRRAPVLVAFVAGAAVLPSCVVGRPGGGSESIGQRIADCVKPHVTVEPVTGMTEQNIVVAGTITAEGRPLENQLLEFRVRESKDSKIIWTGGARTRADGRIAVNMAFEIPKFRSAREGFDRGKLLEIQYVNPAERRQAEPPGWCSTTVTAPFDPVR